MTDLIGAKQVLRRRMRALRRAIPDQGERSEHLWDNVRSISAVTNASTVMVFDSILGEPVTAPFVQWLGSRGRTVLLPEDDPPPDPSIVDVILVPGTAFTSEGDRLGQGGGWYDRFLPRLRPECVTIGVCFDSQIVPELPTEAHDVRLDLVITDRAVHDMIGTALTSD